jgi:UDP-GlcNAc:undecaprenyl-phosphate GlcNAc-1-phosphate transferase
MKSYFFAYFCSLLSAILVTPAVIWSARKFGAIDNPDIRKVHSSPIFRIGGVAIFVSVICLMVPAVFLCNFFGLKFQKIEPGPIALLAASTFMFFVGLVDDVKNLRVCFKLAAQLIAAFCVFYFGIRPDSLELAGLFSIKLGWFAWPFTIFWIVGITNSVNIIDGLDGLAAGISIIACVVIEILAIHFGQPFLALLMFALLGSLSGFLFFNFSPAKIFMGDCGSMFLGFVLASSSIMCASESQSILGLALPAVALGIPIFDTLFSIVRRFLERRSIFAPDRGHFHHKLLDLGLKQLQAVIVAYIITFVLTGLSMFMMVTRGINTIVVFVCILILLVFVFRLVGSVNLREIIRGLRRKYVVTHQMNEERKCFETTQLHFREVKTFDQWWEAASCAAEKMDFLSLNLNLTNRDGSSRVLVWRQNGNGPDHHELLKVNVPLRDRRAGPSLSLRIEVYRDGSLESAGRRVALFTRLIDEFGIISLKCMTYMQSESLES